MISGALLDDEKVATVAIRGVRYVQKAISPDVLCAFVTSLSFDPFVALAEEQHRSYGFSSAEKRIADLAIVHNVLEQRELAARLDLAVDTVEKQTSSLLHKVKEPGVRTLRTYVVSALRSVVRRWR